MTSKMTDVQKEAARRAKRNAIKAKISSVNGKIARARDLIDKFQGCSKRIVNALDDWSGSYNLYRFKPVVYDVEIINTFEGNIAHILSNNIPDTVKFMKETENSLFQVQGTVNTQISKIEDYISQLEAEKRALEAELASI